MSQDAVIEQHDEELTDEDTPPQAAPADPRFQEAMLAHRIRETIHGVMGLENVWTSVLHEAIGEIRFEASIKKVSSFVTTYAKKSLLTKEQQGVVALIVAGRMLKEVDKQMRADLEAEHEATFVAPAQGESSEPN